MSRLASLSLSALVLLMSSTAFAKRVPSMDPIDRDEAATPVPMPRPQPTHVFALPPPSQVDMPPPSVMAPQRALDRQSVRTALAEARARNLAAFRAYQKRGVFPSNTFKGKKVNVWLDADGHLCAAATIIKASGQDDLVNRVAEQNNFIRLSDVKQGPLMDWILTSGLTQDEIAAIQEPFMPVSRKPPIVDPQLRSDENARLAAKYRAVEKMIVKQEKKSLDQATDRLMKHPQLAWLVLDEE